jgi:penicillin amidase
MRVARVLALSCLLVPLGLVAACVGDEHLAPRCDGARCAFEGLSAPVDVRRDDSGMVHVYARTDADAMFASGYMQAHERLLQMDLVRRRAHGRSAEVFGAGKRNEDKLVRLVDIPRRGRENAVLAAEEHPETHALAEAWTAGVNRFVDEVTSGARPLPAGFAELGITPERWDVSDGYAIGKLLLFGNANQIEFDILSTALTKYRPQALERIPLLAPLFDTFTTPVDSPSFDDDTPRRGSGPTGAERPALPADAAARLAAFSATMASFRPGASNNWAVEGALTDTGRPMIAGDPHQGLSSPNIFWAHHVNSADAGGSLDVVGWSFVGTPGIQLGHNRHVAWTATTNYPDTMDLFDVVMPDDATVEIGGERVEVVSREETIVVKDGETETFLAREVPGYGVLFPTELVPLPLVDPGHAILVAWTGLRPTREAHAFLSFDLATSLDAFDAAVDLMEIGCFNFVAASQEGITYRSSPLVPQRTDPAARPPYLMLDGSDPAATWTGAMLPPEQMPRARGEARGFVATANNDPFGFTRDGSIDGDPWYFGVYFDPGTRETRIVQRLEAAIGDDGAVSMDDMKSIQTDVHSVLADEIVPIVADVWAEPPEGEEARAIRARTDVARLVDALGGWDREMTRGQVPPVAFTALSYFLTREVASDDLGIFFGPVADQQPIYILKFGLLALRHPGGGAVQDGRQIAVLRALAATADWLAERFGDEAETTTWGDVHGARFASVGGPSLDGGWVPTDGGDGTVSVASARFFGEGNGEDDRLESRGGAVYRMVAAIGEDGVPRAEIDMPRGLSADPASPYWDNLERDWVEGDYRPLLFRADEIAEHTVEQITIAP